MIDNGDIISVNTDYNYGAKALDIGISGSYSILPDQHAVDAYKDYSFGIDDEAVNNGNYTKFAQIDSGNTNQNGEFNFTFKALSSIQVSNKESSNSINFLSNKGNSRSIAAIVGSKEIAFW